MQITAYISINLLLCCSWYVWLYGKRDCLSFTDRLTGTFILCLTQIIATEMLLGLVFKSLYPLPLFLLNLFISAGVLVLASRTGNKSGLFREIKDETFRISGIISKDKILLCLFTLFLLSVGWMIFLGYLFPSYAWDALYYHLPIVGQIMQSGAIGDTRSPSFIQQYINIFPKNINLYFLWNVIFLKNDVVVDLGQLVFTIAGVLSIYSMAVKLKVTEKYAIYSALLFFFTPVLMLQSTVNYVDGAVSMLLLIAVNFLMYDDMESHTAGYYPGETFNKRAMPLLLSGLAAGHLLGSKPTGPVFIIAIFTVLFIQEVVKLKSASANRGYALKESFRSYLVCFVMPVFLIGGYWYIRNLILYGNPVYYMDVSVFNIHLFKGLKSDWVEPAPDIINSLNYLMRPLYVWLERVGYYLYDSRMSGFGPIWFILFLPGIIISFVHALIKKRYRFLFAVSILLLTFMLHPRNWTTRYVIFIVGLGALSFGFVLDYFNKKENILKIIALVLAAYTLLTVNSPCIMPEKIREFIHLSAGDRTLSRHKPSNIDTKVRDEYGYWIWIENNISKEDTLAYTFVDTNVDTSRPFFFRPLWNRAFSNKVVYISSDNYKEWVNKLADNGASYILVRKASTEDQWIEKERRLYYSLSWMGNIKEKFEIMYSDDNYRIVKYNKG
ncbi:MAG: hypothetical protein C4581_01225 [Nitrospiraceae bacterium]|nr:MAG: hypothetical protein C4581_01225 [Nitrospiraceae bacterium]